MKQSIDRDDLRRRAMAVQAQNGWARIHAAWAFGVSAQTLARMEQNESRWTGMAEATVKRLAEGVAKVEAGETKEVVPIVVHEVPVAVVDLLPITRHTGMLSARTFDGREVFTYRDIAEGLEVSVDVVKMAFSNHKDQWPGAETGVKGIYPDDAQAVRWFARRGVMRFCRVIRSGRSDQLFDHLLDLDDVAAAPVPIAGPQSETDKLARLLSIALPGMQTAIAAVDSKADEALSTAKKAAIIAGDYDPKRLRELFCRLDEIEKEIAGLYKIRGTGLNFSAYRRKLKSINDGQPVSRFSNSITVTALETVVTVAESLLADERRQDMRLFDGAAV